MALHKRISGRRSHSPLGKFFSNIWIDFIDKLYYIIYNIYYRKPSSYCESDNKFPSALLLHCSALRTISSKVDKANFAMVRK